MKHDFLDDPRIAFAKGQEYQLEPKTITKDEIVEFAKEYDPAFFHIDEEAAKNSMLGELIASGFHTCAISMRMICDSFLLRSTSQGAPEVIEVNWHAPVKPGDTLSGKTTVLEARQSASKPNLWIANMGHELQNQNGHKVLSMIVVGLFAISSGAA
ncbi:MAG: MaoC family dehydratase [Rhizobiaceae bacterium]|nr:MaoC family dehydratase [Rhizobiaceae bacterium]